MPEGAITGLDEVDGMTPAQAFHAGRILERARCAKIAKDRAEREWQFALRLSGAERDERVQGRVVAEAIAKDILKSSEIGRYENQANRRPVA